MNERVRKPLYQPERPSAAALPHAGNPASLLETLYRNVWETSMHDMPFVNRALTVRASGFRRHDGDWVGAVITPWFLNLFVLPGGGALWSDLGSGERARVAFPVGELEFIADYQPHGAVPAYLYCPLFAPVNQFATQEAAEAAASAALDALFVPPPVPEAEAADAAPVTDIPAEAPVPARRAFFRRVTGQSR